VPRIEVIPHEEIEPTPTHDLCKRCSRGLREGQDVAETVLADLYSNAHFTILAKLGSVEVEHPEYKPERNALGDYLCECCGTPLGSEDD
jgi:hypothetical protein